MMIRPAELEAFKAGTIDLAFRRWDRPRVKVGTRLRTAIGVLEVLEVEQVAISSLRADDARRAGAASLTALREGLAARAERPVFRIRLQYGGADPREELRAAVPTPAELVDLVARLDRLDASSAVGPWTRATLRIIDTQAERRAPELAEQLGRPTDEFKRDVRKLKEHGLTESLAIGYRLSPRGEALLDHLDGARERAPRREGTPLPRTIGAPATRALRAEGLHTLEEVAGRRRSELAALHGVGPIALDRLASALTDLGIHFSPE